MHVNVHDHVHAERKPSTLIRYVDVDVDVVVHVLVDGSDHASDKNPYRKIKNSTGSTAVRNHVFLSE